MIEEQTASILITGGNGRLSKALAQEMKKSGKESLLLDKKEFDVSDYDAIARIIGIFKPEIIVHAGAYTDVDGSEKNWRLAMKVNLVGTDNLVKLCAEYNIDILFFSTDYVFDGEKDSPYLEDDIPAPVNVYGWSKLGGELAIMSRLKNFYIVRTSFLFGEKYDFIHRLQDALHSKRIPFPSGLFASPTYYPDLARAICTLLDSKKYGIYHITNFGACSRYQFAKTVLRYLDVDIDITTVPQSRFTAQRPRYSVLANKRWLDAGFSNLRSWQYALGEYLVKFR